MGIGKILGEFTGSGVSEVVKGVGQAIDGIFTSDDERLSHAEVMERLKQRPDEAQIELNKIDANSKNFFQAGWRPFIGWICGMGCTYAFVLAPIVGPLVSKVFNIEVPQPSTSELMTLLISMLGMTSTRTYEKMKGINK